MAYPNFQTIDLAMVREASPNPTCDVKFTFLDQNTGVKSELPAHKLILAFGSEVFMKQFFGSIPEERDTIPVEDSPVKVFEVFLDILYNKKIALEVFDFQFLADLYFLAEMYLHDFLKNLIVNEVSSRKIDSGNLLEGAKVAENNAHLGEFSTSLFSICYGFMSKSDLESISDIFDKEDVGEENSCTLHRLMAGSKRSRPNPSNICKNCQHEPCLDGKELTKSTFVAGASISRPSQLGPEIVRKSVKIYDDRVEYEYAMANMSGRTVSTTTTCLVKFSELIFKCT
eukprot:GFUD01017647.1.p1 GENE.GFUD01017647.1~~GFUD01017647.1.p1  ORF type:complete len:285 (-),score=64.61 GFUD01017647.1:127-981(-)